MNEATRSMRFAADVAALASIRDFALDAARELGARVDLEVLAVIVGELAANAAVHQDGEAEITMRVEAGGGVVVSVCDQDPHMPSVVDGAAWDVEGHRGLRLVEGLTAAWGVERRDTGKEVWARMAAKDADDLEPHR